MNLTFLHDSTCKVWWILILGYFRKENFNFLFHFKYWRCQSIKFIRNDILFFCSFSLTSFNSKNSIRTPSTGAGLRGGCLGELTPGEDHPPPLKQWYFANHKDIFDNKKSLFTPYISKTFFIRKSVCPEFVKC